MKSQPRQWDSKCHEVVRFDTGFATPSAPRWDTRRCQLAPSVTLRLDGVVVMGACKKHAATLEPFQTLWEAKGHDAVCEPFPAAPRMGDAACQHCHQAAGYIVKQLEPGCEEQAVCRSCDLPCGI